MSDPLPPLIERDKEVVDTTLSLGQIDTTTEPSSLNPRERKKQRKQTHPLSTYSPQSPRSIYSKVQPGYLVNLDKRTELYRMFSKANWEPILYYNNRKVFPNLGCVHFA